MKNLSSGSFINFMSIFFRIMFWLQLTVVALLIVVNYFSYTSEDGLRFTVRGNLYALADQVESKKVKTTDPTLRTDNNEYKNGEKTIYFLNQQRRGFLRIDYTDFSNAFRVKNILWFVMEISGMILWLLITYLIMRILKSLKTESFFNQQNIKRVSWIGLAFIIIPFIQLLRDQLFYVVASNHLEIPGATLYSNFNWTNLSPLSLFHSNALMSNGQALFPTIILGLIVLLIAQIFKRGWDLQREKELTI